MYFYVKIYIFITLKVELYTARYFKYVPFFFPRSFFMFFLLT